MCGGVLLCVHVKVGCSSTWSRTAAEEVYRYMCQWHTSDRDCVDVLKDSSLRVLHCIYVCTCIYLLLTDLHPDQSARGTGRELWCVHVSMSIPAHISLCVLPAVRSWVLAIHMQPRWGGTQEPGAVQPHLSPVAWFGYMQQTLFKNLF